MSVSLIGNEEEWKEIVGDREVRACLRKMAIVVLQEIDQNKVALCQMAVNAKRGMAEKYRQRAQAIDSELGSISVLLDRLPLEGEAADFKRMMVEKKTALLMEAEEVMAAAKKVPDDVVRAKRLLMEVEGQLANAEFLMRVIEEVEDAEGGIHRVADEPRGSSDLGSASDPVCDV